MVPAAEAPPAFCAWVTWGIIPIDLMESICTNATEHESFSRRNPCHAPSTPCIQ